MKKQDLEVLAELYSSVYGREQLDEAEDWIKRIGKAASDTFADTTNLAAQQADVRTRAANRLKTGFFNFGKSAENVINRAGGYPTSRPRPTKPPAGSPPPTKPPAGSPPPTKPPAGSPPPTKPPAGSPPPRPAASSTVLAKKGGVEGKLDKETGKFTSGAFSSAEKSRYASVAAQNAARNAVPKPPAQTSSPAVGKLGSTSFERRTPTSAELKAAQGARDKGASPEKALQAAQRTNLPTTGPTSAIPDLNSVSRDLTRANTVANLNRAPAGSAAAKELAAKPATSAPTPAQIAGASQGITPATSGTNSINNNDKKNKSVEKQSYEWPSAKTIRDIADAYASIYEAKKKDQDGDKDKDFADVMIARMMASGMSRAEAIAAVRNKTYNEETELDEATRMRKELGKEGEIATRQELARRSNAYQRSGSVDKTIAAAERAADRTTPRGRNESPGDYKARMQKRSRTLRGLAASRRGSVRDKPRAGMRGYAAKVEGSDRDLQTARQRAMSAGTLTPKEKKQLGEEYQIYEIVASYLLENNFAETLNDANVIIENMSEVWLEEILIEKRGEQPLPYGRMMKKSDELSDSDDREKQKRAATIYLAANAPKGPKVKKRN